MSKRSEIWGAEGKRQAERTDGPQARGEQWPAHRVPGHATRDAGPTGTAAERGWVLRPSHTRTRPHCGALQAEARGRPWF